MRGWMDGSDWAWMTVMMILLIVGVAGAVYAAVRLANQPPRSRVGARAPGDDARPPSRGHDGDGSSDVTDTANEARSIGELTHLRDELDRLIEQREAEETRSKGHEEGVPARSGAGAGDRGHGG
jgi:hypothetical protein